MKLQTKMLQAALAGKHQFKKGRHLDANNLYLFVSANGAMSWVFMVTINGKREHIGLGSFTGAGRAFSVSLEEARAKAHDLRSMVAKGFSPKAHKVAVKQASDTTFRVMFEAYLAGNSKDWKGDKQEETWRGSLNTHAQLILDLPVAQITKQHVIQIVKPIWARPVGEAVRYRIERVLSMAKSDGHLTDNVATYKGNLEFNLGRKTEKVSGEGVSHASLPFAQVPALVAKLLAASGLAAKALALCILTATRSTEAREARWSEIDLDAGLWTIPAERMKANKAHVVSLSSQAVALLRGIEAKKNCPYVFSTDGKKPLGETALKDKLISMKIDGKPTVHGMRTAFCGFFNLHLAGQFLEEEREVCLAHSLGAIKGSYNHQQREQRLRPIWQAWGDFCASSALPDSNVISLRAA